VDLVNIGDLVIDNKRIGVANASGQINALLEYFELELGPATRLSTHPRHVEESNHWLSPVWVFGDPLILNTGDRFEVRYQYRMTEDLSRVTVTQV
jgi:hypothetical protein